MKCKICFLQITLEVGSGLGLGLQGKICIGSGQTVLLWRIPHQEHDSNKLLQIRICFRLSPPPPAFIFKCLFNMLLRLDRLVDS